MSDEDGVRGARASQERRVRSIFTEVHRRESGHQSHSQPRDRTSMSESKRGANVMDQVGCRQRCMWPHLIWEPGRCRSGSLATEECHDWMERW